MTPAEIQSSHLFLQNPDRPLTRDMILNRYGATNRSNTRTVDAHVVRLRQKLEPDANSPRHFLTVHAWGTGFCREKRPAGGAVLIVEDAETCASTLEIIFSSIGGLKILIADSAERAWELLESRHEDIRALVTDCTCPEWTASN